MIGAQSPATSNQLLIPAHPCARHPHPTAQFAPAQSQRTVTITPDTKWVNVASGEQIRFIVGTSDFAWKFDGPGARSLDLQLIAPAGALARPITVYVAAAPGHKSQ